MALATVPHSDSDTVDLSVTARCQLQPDSESLWQLDHGPGRRRRRVAGRRASCVQCVRVAAGTTGTGSELQPERTAAQFTRAGVLLPLHASYGAGCQLVPVDWQSSTGS